jgi:hypothetical protein
MQHYEIINESYKAIYVMETDLVLFFRSLKSVTLETEGTSVKGCMPLSSAQCCPVEDLQ